MWHPHLPAVSGHGWEGSGRYTDTTSRSLSLSLAAAVSIPLPLSCCGRVDPSPSLLLWPCRSLSLSLAVAVYIVLSPLATVIAVAEVFPQTPSKMHKSVVCVKQWLKFSLPALSPDSERLCDCNIKTGTRLFLAQKSLSAPPPSAPPPSTPPSVWTHKTTQFWAQLSSFLLQHFSPADTKKIVHKMEEVSEQHILSSFCDVLMD